MYPNLKKKENNKKKKESQSKRKGGDGHGVSVREEKREKGEKRGRGGGGGGVVCFSIRSTEIKPSVFVGVRRKVYPHIACYVWVPKSCSFVKLHEVGNFSAWNIFSLKAI